jgi:hypothetical protein|tara:strand:+ start:5277 stop:6269 length:993 start_codon:yes stop_codon:yes gene_type:complete
MALASKSFSLFDTGQVELVWPANLVDNFDYLQIDISDFVPRARSSSPSITTSSSSTAVPSSGVNIFGLIFGGSIATTNSTTLKKSNTVLLPIPEDINYTDNPQWTDTSVGVLGKFGPQLIQASADAMKGGELSSLVDNIQNVAGAGKISVLLNMLKKTGADPNAITQNLNGKIANPYLEQVFGGIGMREFTFNWKLVPRSEREQKSIHHIIKTMRKSVLPNKASNFGRFGDGRVDIDDITGTPTDNQGGNDRWLTVPKVFNLSWKSLGDEIQSLPKIKTCVCKNVQVSYTPDNVWASHLMDSNPYPVGYNLSLTFGEMEIITGTDVESGY